MKPADANIIWLPVGLVAVAVPLAEVTRFF